ncbi:MAG: chain-length determining protein, partial [Bacteroidaceae bacterium]|nr:chain-length determining protein [Bacteroidaceae bacterium]
MSDYIEKNTSEEEENGGIKLSDIWTIIVLNWQWIALSAFIALCMAFVYLRYTRPVYASAMKILVKDDDNKKFNAGQMGLENMGVISNSNGFDNELEILRSTSLSTRVVKSLKLYTSYYIEGRIRKHEVYNQSPIIVDMPQDELDKLNCSIALKIIPKEKGYQVEGKVYIPRVKEPVKFEREVNELPTTLNTPAGSVTMQLDPSFDLDGRNLYAYIVPPVAAGRNCAARLSANASSKMTTVADISFVDTQIDRAQDFLEELLKGYNEDANEDKNEVARKTEEFIKERIDVIRHELDSTEINLAQYKKSNNLINLTNDAANALTTTTEYHKKQSELQIQMNIVESLIRYMNNPANALDVIPANLGLDNQNLNKLVSDYNTLVQQRKRLLKSSGENNSYVQRITAEIEEMWPSIKLSLDAMKEDLNIQKRGVDRQYSQFSGRIAATPDQERTLNNIGRQQEIKSGLYLMLLEKREENYISLASTAAKARIIDAPQYVGRVSPKSKIIWLLALILGCCFPVGVIYLRNLLRVHIEG